MTYDVGRAQPDEESCREGNAVEGGLYIQERDTKDDDDDDRRMVPLPVSDKRLRAAVPADRVDSGEGRKEKTAWNGRSGS